jgi:signal peptidase I
VRASPRLETAAGALLIAAGVAAVIALNPRVEMARVPSESMIPTVNTGDRVNLNRSAYDGAAPALGDVAILHPPRSAEYGSECGAPHPARQSCAVPTPQRADVKFIKRIVAGPGDRVAFRHGHLVLDGERQREPYAKPCGEYGAGCHLPKPITIPPGRYFVLGDNRGSSDDSRWWGPVREEWIIARVERCRALIVACSPA